MLEKVERVTTDKVVAERLKQWIIENNLQPDDRLPTEQQLSEELGVARHTLREGIKRLSQLGIVGSRAGSGLYISKVNFDNVAEYILFLKQRGYISLDDIVSVRLSLECSVARAAAQQGDGEHIAQLSRLVEKMDESWANNDFKSYVVHDVSFHMTLAESTGNLLFSGIISALRQVIQEHMSSLDETTVSNSLQQHKEILQAVREHDYVLAEELMHKHLMDINTSIIT